MLRKIRIEEKNKYLYAGAFDISDEGKLIRLKIEDHIIELNMNTAVNSTAKVTESLSLVDIKEICSNSNIYASIFPSGNILFRKLESSDDELKSCYLSIVEGQTNKYLICIAFDETQPTLYKAQLVSVFKIEDEGQ